MIAAAVWAGLLGLGAVLVTRGLVPAAPPLARELETFRQPALTDAGAASSLEARVRRLAMALVGRSGGLSQLERDIAVVGTTVERYAMEKIGAALAGAVIAVAFAVMMGVAGIHIPVVAVVLAATVLAIAGFVVPDLTLRSKASDRRSEFRDSLSAYTEVVTIILAGGGGPDAALVGAANQGNSWVFRRIREELAGTLMSGEAKHEALARIGHSLGLPELEEFAGSIQLAEGEGARVRESLEAKAQSMRDHALAEARAKAESQSETMAVPILLMFGGFLLFVLYPAVHAVLAM